ncbi:MAG TPA: hypothetical protein PLI51_07540, partial [bacterium]|nr:hypothetical protein [bacterium]
AYGFGAGLVSPIANASILSRFKPVAGPASAMVAVVLFGMASLTSAVTMNLRVAGTMGQVGAYVAALALIGLAFGHFLVWVPFRRGGRGRSAAGGPPSGAVGTFCSGEVNPDARG